MRVMEAAAALQTALHDPVDTWPGYTPASLPVMIYDDHDFTCLNHPDPPQERPALRGTPVQTINGVLTVCLPASGRDLISRLYAAGFAHYQQTHFAAQPVAQPYRAMAFYPTLNPRYRALCWAEVEVLTSRKLPAEQQAAYLAALTAQRVALLPADTLAYDRARERSDGTAAYVMQKHQPTLRHSLETDATPFRQATTGAALCWLLDVLRSDWQPAVEAGQAPSELLTEAALDLEPLALENKTFHSERQVARVEARARKKMRLIEIDALRVRLPAELAVERDITPARMVAMGDGRILHERNLTLTFPGGHLSFRGCPVIEDYNRHEVIFHALPFRVENGSMKTETLTVSFDVPNIEQVNENTFQSC